MGNSLNGLCVFVVLASESKGGAKFSAKNNRTSAKKNCGRGDSRTVGGETDGVTSICAI